ncbi:general substrate transporter [Plectosphaerella plurivora]|uniref:General substrate transporter n=1 Tax=Plectosphaerella plurivora TaxID=936078 RepID=A0A9P8VNC2_9PEZI|nr:general substrate transporter [Plectosphaerella plurivora]
MIVTADDDGSSRSWGVVRLYLLLIPGSLTISAAMGYDGSLMNGIQGVDRWLAYFHYPKGSLLGIMNAVLPLGAVFGTYPAAWLSDKYGRRWAMCAGDVIMIIASIVQTASMNTAMYMASRFFIGFGLTVAATSAPTIAAELAHPASRTTVTSMYNTLWYLGSIVAAWTTFGSYRIQSDWAWRLPTIIQVVPALVNMISLYFLPESPRWLIGQDRCDEALAILVKYHANGDETSLLVAAEFEEIKETIRLETTDGSSSWRELVRGPANRHRTCLVLCCAFFPQWSGMGLVSYYLAPVLRLIGITSQERITLINGILQIWNMIVAITGASIVGRVGRRPLFLVATGCMLVGMTAWTIAGSVFARTRSEATGAGVLACIVFFVSAYNICWNPLAVAYPVEVMSFTIRAKGIALLTGTAKGASFFNQFVNPIGLENLGWKYYIVYCVWLAIVLTTIFFIFPETKGLSLEEVSGVFERRASGSSENVKILDATEVHCVEVRANVKQSSV